MVDNPGYEAYLEAVRKGPENARKKSAAEGLLSGARVRLAAEGRITEHMGLSVIEPSMWSPTANYISKALPNFFVKVETHPLESTGEATILDIVGVDYKKYLLARSGLFYSPDEVSTRIVEGQTVPNEDVEALMALLRPHLPNSTDQDRAFWASRGVR